MGNERKVGLTLSRELTESQVEAKNLILQAMETSSEGQRFIILTGLSGVGKSTLLEGMEPTLKENKVLATSYGLLGWDDSTIRKTKRHQGLVIIDCDLNEARMIKNDKNFSGIDLDTIIVKGMNEAETKTLFINLLGTQKTKVPVDILTNLSLGVPLLVEEFVAEPNLTREIAVRMAASYLTKAWGIESERLLKIKPSQEVLELSQKIDPMETSSIYDCLSEILKRKSEREDFKALLSPLFVASESERIYSEMASTRDNNRSRIIIFAPNIPAESMTIIEQELKDFSYEKIAWCPRFHMFAAGARKTTLWMKDLSGREQVYEGEFAEVNLRILNDLNVLYGKGDFPIQKTKGQIGQLFLSAHEHTELTLGPAIRGWVIESLLQQLGVSYYANNATIGKKYLFNPETKDIEYLE